MTDRDPTSGRLSDSGEAARASSGRRLTAAERRQVYAARRFIGSELEEKLRIRVPFDVYFQDPMVAATDPELGFDPHCFVPWEPGLTDGPTSARFAVVDYDAHTETIAPPARWDAASDSFLDPDGRRVDRANADSVQFHQVNVWAIAQRALDFFESASALGRRIPWGFEGGRLLIVPHAGPGENAFYDRQSKSLQFYYFDRAAGRVHTCLSTDIVHHEFGHAVLDGIHPHYMESVVPETAAFHEFMGDLTAVLIALRNTAFRQRLVATTNGRLDGENPLSSIAEEFGRQVSDKPYLRSAANRLTMRDVANDQRPHYLSQVLTGAMFDVLVRLTEYYVTRRGRTVAQAFWDTIQRMQGIAIQPLDLLPPIDVTFRDYALAVLRSDEIASPIDPDGYRAMMLDVFIKRGILDEADREESLRPRHVFERLALDVFHDIDVIAGSRADAYRFLDDNRDKLFIPWNADVVVADLYAAQKFTRQARRLPRQVIVKYVWREDVVLDGVRFGQFDGQSTTMLCGGTLALDQNGDLLAWARKPGSQANGDSDAGRDEQYRGAQRRAAFLDAIARRVRAGRISNPLGTERGLLSKSLAPLTSRVVDGTVRFELSPHFGIHDDEDDPLGGRSWQTSS
jgi:hypothetical protein